MLCSAKPTCAMLRVFFQAAWLVSGRGVSRNLNHVHSHVKACHFRLQKIMSGSKFVSSRLR